jgi:hypothetical protein
MQAYAEDVVQKTFPAEEHSITMNEEEWAALQTELEMQPDG